MLLAARQVAGAAPSVGTLRNGTVYEQFFTTVPPHAFTPADVLDLYLHRGSFETVLADEDQEQDSDRWVSHTPCGQEFWQIIAQWIWNLRLEFGQQVSAPSMRVTDFAYSQIDEPVKASEPTQADVPTKADASICSGPAQWARRSFTKGFAGADFTLQPDGTLRCPADHPLYPAAAARGARWLCASALCRPHWPLSRLSSARPVSSNRHHQQTATGECRVLATDFHDVTAQ
jgi:hypothetical protein